MKAGGKKVLLLTLAIGASFTAGVYASDGIERVDAFLRPDFKVMADGKQAILSQPPLIYDNRSYLPLKELAGLLNADINWQENTRTIYVNSRVPGLPVRETEPDEHEPGVTIESPAVYEADYLGGKYTLLCIASGYLSYYRASDLLEMGVDIRGLKKVKENYTGMQFVRQDEVQALWKEVPVMRYSMEPAISGTTDQALRIKLKELASKTIPLLGNAGVEPYSRYTRIFAIDAVPGKAGWFLMLSSEGKSELQVYAVNAVKDDKGEWNYRTIQRIALSYVPRFVEDLK